LSETKPTTIETPEAASTGETTAPSVSIRVSPHGYFSALLLGTFASGFLFYIENDAAGVLLFGLSWILLPFFALNDRVVFDGKRLIRTGFIPAAWAWINTTRRRLRLTDIEHVESQSIRAMRRGGNVYYRYRTVFRGKGVSVAVASGGEDFRRMIQGILPKLPENVLDNRSIELRDHLADPKETQMRAEFARIPSADVLESSFRSTTARSKQKRATTTPTETHAEEEHADDLRSLANELRVAGHLVQALEAFRRALLLRPRDARLIFEFARCLNSVAGMNRDSGLERRSIAALRLSGRRAGGDGDLLARLGEAFFEIGEWRRATKVFQDALERVGESFRTARGLAEIALRDGKIAHVIHHFSTANRLAETPSLRRWARGEAEYFSHLNSDEEYMELEIGRVNMLDTVENSKRTALRIAILGFPAVLVGVLTEDTTVANIGWAVSTVALLIWTGLIITGRMLAQRIPYELVESDE